MESIEVISDFGRMVNKEDIIITEYGYISNIMHQLADRKRTLYMLDENIDPIALGMGTSFSRKEKTFIFISEDTFESLLSSLINIVQNKPQNLIIIVFNFKTYEQFLQKQIFSSTVTTELSKITKTLGLKSFHVTKIKEFKAVLKKVYNNKEPAVIELMINRVKISESLHKIDFTYLKKRFMNSLKRAR